MRTRRYYSADGTLEDYSDVITYDEYGNKVMNEHYMDGELYWKTYYIYEQL